MPQTMPPDPLTPAAAARVAELARALKAAARAVGLYPAGHPAIEATTGRLLDAAARATAAGPLAITVLPDTLLLDGRAAARPDAAVVEIAALLHGHLVGELRIDPAATATEWQMFLRLLARTTEEVRAEGGLARALTTTGAHHLQVREIDYGQVLRERAGDTVATWDDIIASCLEGEGADLDERTLQSMLALARDGDRFAAFLEQLQARGAGQGRGIGLQAAALLRLLHSITGLLEGDEPGERDRVLDNLATAASRLSPDLMLALVSTGREPQAGGLVDPAAAIVSRMSEGAIARFVARTVAAEGGATERLAQAFQTLVPDERRRDPILDAARAEAGATALGADPGFPALWDATRTLLKTYSDAAFVSDAYGRELSATRTQAIEVERVSDDPPERIGAWLSSVGEASVQQLDQQLMLDLLRIESAPDRWRDVADMVAGQIEKSTLEGDFRRATPLMQALVQEAGPDGRAALREPAAAVRDRLASGPLMRHIVLYLRKVEDADVPPIAQVCTLMGTVVVRPLAEALAAEEGGRSLRRLRELLIGFGAAGRDAVEQLKSSPNPAVRRTAVDLLRVFGGREALPELEALLEDSEPQVQRQAIRAIVQIGTSEAFGVLQRALTSRTSKAREAIIQSIGALRDERAAPLFCHVLRHTDYRGALQPVHLEIIEALGAIADADQDAVAALRDVLYRGQWWAPGRTATFRRAAAVALRRIGTPAALRVLEEAAARGSRGARAAARDQLAAARSAGGERHR